MSRMSLARRCAAIAAAVAVGVTVGGDVAGSTDRPGPQVAVVGARGASSPPPVHGPGAGVAPGDATALSGARGQVIAANFDVGVAQSAQRLVAPTLWWKWRAPSTGRFTFSTASSEFDTTLTAFTGTAKSLKPLASNDNSGDLLTSSVSVTVTSGQSILLAVSSKSGDPGVATLSWSPATGPAATVAPGLPQPTPDAAAPPTYYQNIPLTGTTGEKPQSKLWQYGGSWWAVLASTAVSPAGTWLWQLTPNGWTNVLLLSSATDLRGDALASGDVTHILLHGASPQLVSIEYDRSTGSYKPWSVRPAPTAVSLPGSETATLAIDSTGRMWVATDNAPAVEVRYSDAPYTSFSAPITIATGILPDDIADVVAMKGQVGVLWSNQAAKRFGFRAHADGAGPTTWGTAEIPAASSAVDVGHGMADDHINMAMASNGTLYASVKTSYDTTGYPVLGLLVRHPDGTWDPFHPIDSRGTRPNVLLNEAAGLVSVAYTKSTSFSDILVKTAPISTLDFSASASVALKGSYNNVTTTKANWTDKVLLMAGSATSTGQFFLTADTSSGPVAPVAGDGSVSVVAGGLVKGSLPVASSSGGALTFQVVGQPSLGTVTLDDAATGAFSYTAGGTSGADSFTFRVSEGGLWSAPATMSVTVLEAGGTSGVLGSWLFDEGSGRGVSDSSGAGNDGVISGNPTWVSGVAGSALRFDGKGDYVTVPDAASLDVSGAMSIATWVRPEKTGTQYLVKKATGSVDGYEIGLSSSGTIFFRVNAVSSGNTYRVDSTSTYPTNGSTWVHVVGTFDGTTMRLFINGSEQASAAGPSAIATNALGLTLGAEDGGSRTFTGAMDATAIYDHALTAAEITALAKP